MIHVVNPETNEQKYSCAISFTNRNYAKHIGQLQEAVVRARHCLSSNYYVNDIKWFIITAKMNR